MADVTTSQTVSGTLGASASEDKDIVFLAMDGSDNSMQALDWYLAHMHKPSSEVYIVHCSNYNELVWTPVMCTDSSALCNMIHLFEQETTHVLQQVQIRLAKDKVTAKLLRLSGESGSAIVRAAKEHNVNYIVTGSRGLSKIKRTLLGSVSSYILHHAHCPVLICPRKNQ